MEIDLTLVPDGERFELLCCDLLRAVGARIERQPSRGADHGVDIIAVFETVDIMGFTVEARVAVECKHHATSNRSVTEANVGNIIERTLSNGCNRYLLITSTLPSVGLAHQLDGITNNPAIPASATSWNRAKIIEILHDHPTLVDQHFAGLTKPKLEIEDEKNQTVFIHAHPDFQDELLELISDWNETQSVLHFMPLIPTRESEHFLLSNVVLDSDRAYEISETTKADSGLLSEDGLILFCEGRLHTEDTYQLFTLTYGQDDREFIDFSVISLRMIRLLADEDLDDKSVSKYALIVLNILSVLSKSVLSSHEVSRGCILDYCNIMPEIVIGLKFGPKFCPECEKIIRASEATYLLELARVAKDKLSQKRHDSVSRRMQKRMDSSSLNDASEYDIALSFAGSDRQKAEELARNLTSRGLRVFYDSFEKAQLWGEDLFVYLSDLYRLRAKYCVMFVSSSYASRLWTNHERKAAQARAFEENRAYILPIRIDETEIPGLHSTVGYLTWGEDSAESIAEMLHHKVNMLDQE